MHAAPKAASAWLSKSFCTVSCTQRTNHCTGRLFPSTHALLPRLKTAEQFAAVLDASKLRSDGSGVWRSPHFVLHMAPLAALTPALPDLSGPVIGVICPKRWAKRAVTRNTLKRQIYAVTRELVSQLPSACLVLRLAAGFSREEFTSATSVQLKRAAREEIQSLLGKLPRRASA